MKKIILTLILALTTVIVFGQHTKFGLKGGLNIANQKNSSLSGSVQTNTSSLIGFNIGGCVEIELANKISIQPELLFSSQGGKLSIIDFINTDIYGNGVYANIESLNKLSYINIPIMFKYYVLDNFTLELGPQLGVLVSSTNTTSINGSTNSSKNTNDYYRTIDYGINLGAGYNISKNVAISIRYNIGLNNIGKYSTEIKNNVFSISTNYNF